MERVGVMVVGVVAPVDPRLDVLGGAGNAPGAVALAARARPQVALVGTGHGSAEVIRALVEHRVAVLAVAPGPTGLSDAVLDAVQAGAAGCVLRPVTTDAVLRTAAGEAVFSPGLAKFVLDAHSTVATRPSLLTEREAEVLGLVVEGLTGRQIATRLTLSPRTVENHVQRVLRKLGQPNRAALVRYAIEHGLA